VEAVLRRVPGFRSGTRWKQVLAGALYVGALLFLLQGWWSVAMCVLTAALLVAGLRRRLPLVGSSSRLEAGVGYFVLGSTALLVWAINLAMLTSTPHTRSSCDSDRR
jgi:hypothetical protein